MPVSYASALRLLRRVPVPEVRVPRVIGVADFALRRRHSYATIIINAETVSESRYCPAAKPPLWKPGCADIRASRPCAGTDRPPTPRRSDEPCPTRSRSATAGTCGTTSPRPSSKKSPRTAPAGRKRARPRPRGRQAASTRERWQQVHALRERGVGLLECACRLNLALDTVKRYDRVAEPERLIRAPKYRPTLVDPYRDHLRRRRLENPAVPVTHLLQEIRELGYTGSSNLLVRYINQGRVEADRPALSPRRLARYLLTRPDRLKGHQRERVEAARTACHEMTALADLIHHFAVLLDPADGNAVLLSTWITSAQAEDLPHLHAFTRGLEKDRAAVDAALTLPYHNGGTEGVNNKTKLIKRQMYGRASFPLLRHRDPPGLTTPSVTTDYGTDPLD
ncbi:transposase [Streptomyces griseoflavus Tu4000]|uniref:Transposase n=1 Tax=Streptomyces griseoflavus Tu4000 TaxID=467200 RepID=D9Y298_9ACTN|nr:transposase [Streptomyces griseoflavus Tu4000]